MTKNFTYTDVQHAYQENVSAQKIYLENLDSNDSETLKLAYNHFKWTALKTNLIVNENNFKIPYNALPNKFSMQSYNWLLPEKKNIFDKYYKYNPDTNYFVINTKKNSIPYDDFNLLMHSLVLTRKAVVWVEFGVNIGAEFGGRHPAIILKNLDDSFIVLPLSSQEPSNDKFSVKINSVHGFPTLTRWANVTRIREIDISRIDFSHTIGNVNSTIMKNISDKMHSCGII